MTSRRNVIAVGMVLAAVALLASGCGRKKSEPTNLPLACETTPCICTEADKYIWQKGKEVPVLWRPTGEAFCPEGYLLQVVAPSDR